MRRNELNMDLERRRSILELVQTYPGLHLSEIARRLTISPMLAEYHLRVLERHELVSSIEEDHYHRYYAKVDREGLRVDALGAQDKRLLALLRHPVRLHLLMYLAAHEEGRNKEIAKELGLSRPATSYQLGKLVRMGILSKNEDERFRLLEPDRVTRLLLTYQPPPDLVERFRNLWDRLGQAQTPTPSSVQEIPAQPEQIQKSAEPSEVPLRDPVPEQDPTPLKAESADPPK